MKTPLPLGGRGWVRVPRLARPPDGASPAGLAAGPLSHPLPASGERGFAAGVTQDEGRWAADPSLDSTGPFETRSNPGHASCSLNPNRTAVEQVRA